MRRFVVTAGWVLAMMAAVLAWVSTASAAHAQDISYAQTVSACGTPNNTPKVGNPYPITQDTTGTLCTIAGGGGGGGNVSLQAGAVHAGAYVAGSILAGAAVDGWNVTLGTIADAACSTDNGSCTEEALIKRTNQRVTSLITALGSPFQAGGSIGNTGFNITGTLPAFASTPTFNCGTGCGATGSVSNASSLATSSTSLNTIGYNYVFDGTTWRQVTAILDGSVYAMGIDWNTSSQAHADMIASIPAGTAVIGYTTNDPCGQLAKSTAHFSSTSSGGNFITGTAAKQTYICSLSVVVSAGTNFSLCEATGTACAGGTTAAVYGNTGTTAANGQAFAANGGIQVGTGGFTIAKTATAGQNIDVLFVTTNTPQVNVDASYVQQ